MGASSSAAQTTYHSVVDSQPNHSPMWCGTRPTRASGIENCAKGRAIVLGQRVEEDAHGADRDDAGEREASADAARERTASTAALREALERDGAAEREERRAHDEIARPHGPAGAPLDEARVHADHDGHAHEPHDRDDAHVRAVARGPLRPEEDDWRAEQADPHERAHAEEPEAGIERERLDVIPRRPEDAPEAHLVLGGEVRGLELLMAGRERIPVRDPVEVHHVRDVEQPAEREGEDARSD